MEASLLSFVLDVAESLVSEVEEDFGEYALHGFVPAEQWHTGRVASCHGEEAVVGYVDGRSVAVAGVGRGVLVATLQFCHVVGCSKDGGDHEQVDGHSLSHAGVDEVDAYGVEHVVCFGHEIGHGVGEVVDNVVG